MRRSGFCDIIVQTEESCAEVAASLNMTFSGSESGAAGGSLAEISGEWR